MCYQVHLSSARQGISLDLGVSLQYPNEASFTFNVIVLCNGPSDPEVWKARSNPQEKCECGKIISSETFTTPSFLSSVKLETICVPYRRHCSLSKVLEPSPQLARSQDVRLCLSDPCCHILNDINVQVKFPSSLTESLTIRHSCSTCLSILSNLTSTKLYSDGGRRHRRPTNSSKSLPSIKLEIFFSTLPVFNLPAVAPRNPQKSHTRTSSDGRVVLRLFLQLAYHSRRRCRRYKTSRTSSAMASKHVMVILPRMSPRST